MMERENSSFVLFDKSEDDRLQEGQTCYRNITYHGRVTAQHTNRGIQQSAPATGLYAARRLGY